jgi:acyl-CoA thioester hydrolase
MSLCNLSSKISIRIYYEDTDAGGIVYHSKYLNFAERARAEFLRSISLEQTYIKEKYQIQFVVKNLKVSYLSSCKLDDQINLVTDLELINRAKICFRHIFYEDKKEISKIQVTVCCLSNTGKVARMPKSLYHKFIN